MFAEHSGEQVISLLICGGFGVAFGLYLDLLTLLTPTRTPRPLAAVRDAIAVVIAAVAFFLLSLPLTAGRLRWYLFAGAGLGWWVYCATLHRLLTAIGSRVRRWLARAADRVRRWNEAWRRPLRNRVLFPLQKRLSARLRTLRQKAAKRRAQKRAQGAARKARQATKEPTSADAPPAARHPRKARSKSFLFCKKLSKNG